MKNISKSDFIGKAWPKEIRRVIAIVMIAVSAALRIRENASGFSNARLGRRETNWYRKFIWIVWIDGRSRAGVTLIAVQPSHQRAFWRIQPQNHSMNITFRVRSNSEGSLETKPVSHTKTSWPKTWTMIKKSRAALTAQRHSSNPSCLKTKMRTCNKIKNWRLMIIHYLSIDHNYQTRSIGSVLAESVTWTIRKTLISESWIRIWRSIMVREMQEVVARARMRVAEAFQRNESKPPRQLWKGMRETKTTLRGRRVKRSGRAGTWNSKTIGDI